MAQGESEWNPAELMARHIGLCAVRANQAYYEALAEGDVEGYYWWLRTLWRAIKTDVDGVEEVNEFLQKIERKKDMEADNINIMNDLETLHDIISEKRAEAGLHIPKETRPDPESVWG